MNEVIKTAPTQSAEATNLPTEYHETAPAVNLDAWIEQRQEFIQKVGAIMVETKDYHIIQGKKSLAKGGAEKLASIFTWQAKFIKDTESLEMLGSAPGVVAFICDLYRADSFVGQGRGAAILAKNGGDPNKTLKMAQKSAFIDAVIRSSGLSDIYTQDLEDMSQDNVQDFRDNPVEHPITTPRPQIKEATPGQKKLIKDLMEQKGLTLDDLADDGIIPGKSTPQDVIDYLFEAKSKIMPNGQVIFHNNVPGENV